MPSKETKDNQTVKPEAGNAPAGPETRPDEAIDNLEADLKSKLQELDVKTASIDNLEADLKSKVEELTRKAAELEEKENALAEKEAELSEKEEALRPPRTPAVHKGRARRFICVRRCYHWLRADEPETRKIYEPGDKYTAYGDEEVPRHFREIKSSKDMAAAKAEIERETMTALPPHLAKKQKTVHG